MLDKIHGKGALDQICRPGLGLPGKGIAVSLTLAFMTLNHSQLVEVLPFRHKEHFEIALICPVGNGAFLPVECVTHLRRTHTGNDQSVGDQEIGEANGFGIRRIAHGKGRPALLLVASGKQRFGVLSRKQGGTYH
jgi:hypothetical protein